MSTTAEKKSRKGRKPANKTPYRQEGSAKLTEWPSDFDSSKHQPLSVDDFDEACQYVFWDRRKEYHAAKAAEAEREADLCRRFGSKEQRAKVSQLERLTAQLAALKAELGDLA